MESPESNRLLLCFALKPPKTIFKSIHWKFSEPPGCNTIESSGGGGKKLIFLRLRKREGLSGGKEQVGAGKYVELFPISFGVCFSLEMN